MVDTQFDPSEDAPVDRRIAANTAAKISRQALDLGRGFDIPREKDEPRRIEVAVKRGLTLQHFNTSAAKDRRAGACRHLCATGVQSALSASNTAQNRRVPSSVSKPIARRR